ncbi:MAG: murein biosynthesis integral membrane protein MurJ [Pirellulales bacterium]
MNHDASRQIVRGFWATSLGTLASRVLGVLRDVVTAALLGLGEGGVMDALVVAVRLPNLPRRIFGEGARAASLLPVFSAEHHRDPRSAWRLISVLLVLVAVGLSAVVLVGEAICALWWWFFGPTASHVLGLTAVLLPYMVFACLAAQISTVLQAMLQFRLPAFVPVLLNICWLAAAWFVAPWFSGDPAAQAYVIALAILVAGVLQVAVQLPALAGVGFRFDFDWQAAKRPAREVGRALVPITLGLAVTQLNTLLDTLIAVGLAAPSGEVRTISWLGGALEYPLQTGAAAAIYYGERFYQLPVGVLGMAIATVIYPLLAAHAARGEVARIGADLTLGLRLVWFTALPAGIGIVLLARPLVRLLFERGAFTPDDTARAAAMIACYAGAAWAYCALPVLVRGYYALGNRMAPAWIGLFAVSINLTLSLALIWPLAERGLAISTAVAASVQAILLTVVFSRGGSPLAWRGLASTILRGTLATLAMTAAVMIVEWRLFGAETSRAQQALEVTLAILTGVAVYLIVAWLLGMRELALLMGRGRVEP